MDSLAQGIVEKTEKKVQKEVSIRLYKNGCDKQFISYVTGASEE